MCNIALPAALEYKNEFALKLIINRFNHNRTEKNLLLAGVSAGEIFDHELINDQIIVNA